MGYIYNIYNIYNIYIYSLPSPLTGLTDSGGSSQFRPTLGTANVCNCPVGVRFMTNKGIAAESPAAVDKDSEIPEWAAAWMLKMDDITLLS